MKKAFAAILATACILSTCAMAAGELTVTQQNYYHIPGETSGLYTAIVENTGDAPAAVGNCCIEFYDAAGNFIFEQKYIGAAPSGKLLQPGDSTYINGSLWDSVLETAEVAECKLIMETVDYYDEMVEIPCEATIDYVPGDWKHRDVYVSVTNPLDEPKYGFEAVVALMDEEGNVISLKTEKLYNTAVHPGSTVTMKVSITNTDMFVYYDVAPASMDVKVYYYPEA